MRKAVFIDKDGTLIKDVPYNVDPELIELSSSCIEGLFTLQQAGYRLVVITNQSGIARGYFSESALKPVQHRIEEIFRAYALHLDGFYYCPHHPGGTIAEYATECTCRKPMPGMIKQACEELSIDANGSWMIGDILNDIEAGNRAGCKTILLDNGNETEWIISDIRKPHYTVRTINEAANHILEHEYREGHYDISRTHQFISG